MANNWLAYCPAIGARACAASAAVSTAWPIGNRVAAVAMMMNPEMATAKKVPAHTSKRVKEYSLGFTPFSTTAD